MTDLNPLIRQPTPKARTSRTRYRSAAICLLALLTNQAIAWGHVGHAVIAARAQARLDPAAQRALEPMLAALGAHSLAEIASWPDDRSQPANRALARSHYVNLPPDCHYVAQRDCPDGQCVVEELRHQVAILSDTSLTIQQRSVALPYVVHFVSDSSQPLHAGMASDRGGNTYQIRDGNRGSNLHKYYDSGLIEDLAGSRDEQTQFDTLMSTMDHSAHAQGSVVLDPQAWVENSCRIVQTPGFYPGRVITPAYARWATPIVLDQLQVGSDELAATLNAALSGRRPF